MLIDNINDGFDIELRALPLLAILLQIDPARVLNAGVRGPIMVVGFAILREWARQRPGLDTATLSQADRETLTDALGYALADALWGPFKTGAASGVLASIKNAEGSQLQFAGAALDPRVEWREKAALLLNQAPAIRGLLAAQVRPARLFGNVSPRRECLPCVWGWTFLFETEALTRAVCALEETPCTF